MAETTDYPRVLVFAVNPISRIQSNGILMRSFFQGWPADRLAQVYYPFFHHFPPDTTVCRRFLRVGPLGQVAKQDFAADAELKQPFRSPFAQGIRRLANKPELRGRFVDPLREALVLLNPADQDVLQFSREFAPDVIYTLLGTLNVTRTAAKVAEALGCPIVPHFTDHWIDTRFSGSFFAPQLRESLDYWLQRVADRSPFFLTMTSLMARDYEKLFSKPCRFFTTVIEQEPYLRAESLRNEPQPSAQGADSRALRLVYAGNLGLERWRVLADLGHCLEILKEEGIEAHLEVYCSAEDQRLYRRKIEQASTASVVDWVPPEKLPALLVSADVLVHVESEDPDLLRYTRYSFSTKLSQYMMAGRPLLLVGPVAAGSMREVQRMESGVVVDSKEPEELMARLRHLLMDDLYRERLGNTARERALEYFEAKSKRDEFRSLLVEVVEGRQKPPLSEPETSPLPTLLDARPQPTDIQSLRPHSSVAQQSPSQQQRIFRAFSWVVLANLARQVSFLVVNIVLFDRLSRSTFGALALAFGYMQIFAGLGEFGIRQIGWREVARRPDQVARLVGPFLTTKSLASVLSLGLYLALLPWLWTATEDPAIYALYGLGILLNGGTFDFPYFGLNRIDLYAKYSLVSFGLYLTCCFLLVTEDSAAPRVPALFAASMAILFLLKLRWFVRHHGRFGLGVRIAELKRIVREAWPLGLGESLNRMALGYPIILIGFLIGSEGVGNYRVAELGYSFLAQFGHMFAAAGFSQLSHSFHSRRNAARLTIARMFGLALVTALVMGLCLALLGPPVFRLIFDDVSHETYQVLKVLGLALVFAAPVRLLKGLLASIDQQRMVLAVNALAIFLGAGYGITSLASGHGILSMAAAVLTAEVGSLIFLVWVYFRTLKRAKPEA